MPDSSFTPVPPSSAPEGGPDRAPRALGAAEEAPGRAPRPTVKEVVLANLKTFVLSVVVLAGLWGVAFLVLQYGFEYSAKEAVGFACLVTLVGAFFVRSFVPHYGEKVKAAPSSAPHHTDSAREVVETVVFVVVLVLLLKSFAAEAFVIPTGSMAETLYGYQKIVPCPQCGLEFPVNCSSEVEGNDGERAEVRGCICPNCRYVIRFDGPKGLAKNPPPFSGDRVLVSKYVYDIPGSAPGRLDVVVFKFPGDDKFPERSGPIKRHVPMNYIKRLVGLPGETIAIHRGKLYVLPDSQSLYPDDVAAAGGDASKLALLWQPRFMHTGEEESKKARDQFREGKFGIVRKGPGELLAMMRLVYDNDHQAADLKGDEWQRWAPQEGTGWSATDKSNKAFKHDGSGGKMGWLRYRHVLRPDASAPEKDRPSSESSPQLITDFMGYNTWLASPHMSPPAPNWASDLIVECTARVERLQGLVALELSKGPDRFQALFDLGKGECELRRLTSGKEAPLKEGQATATAALPIKKAGSYQLRFANVDDRLTVWVDGKLLFKDGVEYTAAKGLHPTKENDLEPVSVGSQGAAVTLSQLKIYRDTYYTTAQHNHPRDPDVSRFSPTDPTTWPGVAEAPVATYFVQPDHYLCLGDNSPESSDGRTWGLVPRRLMLGRALLVYYPFGRAGRIR